MEGFFVHLSAVLGENVPAAYFVNGIDVIAKEALVAYHLVANATFEKFGRVVRNFYMLPSRCPA